MKNAIHSSTTMRGSPLRYRASPPRRMGDHMYVQTDPLSTPARILSKNNSHGSSQMNRGIRAMKTHTMIIEPSRSDLVRSRWPGSGSHGIASAATKQSTTKPTNVVDATTWDTPAWNSRNQKNTWRTKNAAKTAKRVFCNDEKPFLADGSRR